MVAERQKSQMELAFDPGSRGEPPRAGDEGTEATMTKSRTESSASMTRFTVRTAVYVTRTHGGVGGGAPRGAPLSRLWGSHKRAGYYRHRSLDSLRSLGMTKRGNRSG